MVKRCDVPRQTGVLDGRDRKFLPGLRLGRVSGQSLDPIRAVSLRHRHGFWPIRDIVYIYIAIGNRLSWGGAVR